MAEQLPVEDHADAIIEAVMRDPVVVIQSGPGDGKTSLIPQILLEAGVVGAGRIVVTYPYSWCAALALARGQGIQRGREGHRPAALGLSLSPRDLLQTSNALTFTTERILLDAVALDADLRPFGLVIVDEAQERVLEADLVAGYLRLLQARRTDLKVVILVTSLESTNPYATFFGTPNLRVDGVRHEPVVTYLSGPSISYQMQAEDLLRDIHLGEEPGDIAVFVPTPDRVSSTVQHLQRIDYPGLQVVALHENMDASEIENVFAPRDPRKTRRAVITTGFIDGLLVPPGIRHVVDAGLTRLREFHPSTGISRSEIGKATRQDIDSRVQIASHAPRGVVHCLYTEADYFSRPMRPLPEIQRRDVTEVAFRLLELGVRDVRSFPFMEKLPIDALQAAVGQLGDLGAIEHGQMTEVGQVMRRLKLPPRIARMIAAAAGHGCVAEVATVVAALSAGDLFLEAIQPGDSSVHEEFRSSWIEADSDFITALKIWRGYVDSRRSEAWARQNGFRPSALILMAQAREQIVRALNDAQITITSNQYLERPSLTAKAAITKAVASGLMTNILEHVRENEYRRGTERIILYPNSVLTKQGAAYIVAGLISDPPRRVARFCAQMEYAWLTELNPTLYPAKGCRRPAFLMLTLGLAASASAIAMGIPRVARRANRHAARRQSKQWRER